MNFLIILIAVALEFTVSSLAAVRSRDWAAAWLASSTQLFGRFRWWRGWFAAAVILGVPAITVYVLFDLLHAVSPLLVLAASLAALLMTLGPQDLGREVEVHKLVISKNPHASIERPAFVVAARGIDFGAPTGDAEFDAARVDIGALALSADRAWFQPLFWFFVLGPPGAVLYRLTANLQRVRHANEDVYDALGQALEGMEWLQARITVIALGLAGTLVPVMEHAREFGFFHWGASSQLVARAAIAAADNGRIREVIGDDARIYRLNAMLALLKRALVAWLMFAAGLTLILT